MGKQQLLLGQQRKRRFHNRQLPLLPLVPGISHQQQPANIRVCRLVSPFSTIVFCCGLNVRPLPEGTNRSSAAANPTRTVWNSADCVGAAT